jgi:hypothetical protein
MVGVAGGDALAHKDAKVMRKVGPGLLDRLVAADETAKFFADLARACFEDGVLQHLVGQHRPGRRSGG